jgi:hypothetical protein
MTTFQRSAAICGALLVLPIAAVLVFRARDDVQVARPEPNIAEPIPPPVAAVAPPAMPDPKPRPTPVRAAVPVAPGPPATPPPEQERDYAVDDSHSHARPARSDPSDIERPARLDYGALSRAMEGPAAEGP